MFSWSNALSVQRVMFPSNASATLLQKILISWCFFFYPTAVQAFLRGAVSPMSEVLAGHFDLRVPVVMAVIDVYTKLSISDVVVELVVSEEGPSVHTATCFAGHTAVLLITPDVVFACLFLLLTVGGGCCCCYCCNSGGGGAHVGAWGVSVGQVVYRDLCHDSLLSNIQEQYPVCYDLTDGL